MKKGLLKVLCLVVTLCMLIGCTVIANAVTTDKNTSGAEASTINLQKNTQDGVILHAFCWSYDTIKDNLSAIAEAGYSTIQTSPVQQPKNYGHWYDVTGQYWKLYQPLTYSIANESWLGTKEDLTELCTEAHKYGIKIICDVVMNHLGNDTNGTTGTLYDGLADTLPEIYNDYKDNYNTNNADKLKYLHFCTKNALDSDLQSITQGYVNNLISLNTGSDYIQELATGLLKECVDCGVDGFRFDAAKHIETPDDGDYASDYWPNVLGAASDYARKTQDGKELFYYGEILNSVGSGRNVESYTKYMSVTDNREGDSVTGYVYKNNAQSASNVMKNNGTGTFIGAAADKTVLWAESHDTYLGTSGAGGLSSTKNVSNEVIMKSWALNASRKDATSLYFARPGVLMSEVGDLSWKSTAVSEVNKFHNKFVGENESVGYSGDLAYNQRGTTGIVIVNCNGNDADVNISGTTMADGSYIDTITGNEFTVKDGTVTGKMGSTGIAVVYDGAVSPKIAVSKGNTTFKGESFTFTATAENAESATYQIGDSEAVPFTGTTEITVGAGYEYGEKIPVKLTAVKGDLTSTVTYFYEKLQPANTGLYVYFDNSKAQYDEVYCYAFDRYNNDDNYSINNRSWPGEKMEYDSATGLYYYEIPDVNGTVTVPDGEGTKDVELSLTKNTTAGAIFTDGKGHQYPGQASKKILAINGKNHILTAESKWGETSFTLGSVYGMLGECDSDSTVNIKDATYIQKALVGKKQLVSVASKNADVNGDKQINIEDVTLIQKYCAGFSVDYEIGVSHYGDVSQDPDPTEPLTTVPTAPEGEMVFYVVAKNPGATSIFSNGCKMWIYNNDTGEAIETIKQEAETDDQVVYAYANIPQDWKNLSFYRTSWTTTELDINDSLNTLNSFKPTRARTDEENAISLSMSSTKYTWSKGYNPVG